MKTKTVKIIYWSVTVFFTAAMLADGIAGIMQVEAGKEGLAHLGYPVYFMTILGTAKILGSLAILQTKFQTLKEWAYAGFTFNFISAFVSHAFVGDGAMSLPPLVVLAIMSVSYISWKRVKTLTLDESNLSLSGFMARTNARTS